MKDDVAGSIVSSPDGGFVIAGTTSSNNGDVSGNHGYADIWIIKTDVDGKKIWQKTFGGSGNERAASIINTSDGGFAIAGSTTSNDGDVHFNNGDADVWIIKISKDGELLWEKTYGGSKTDGANAIVETSDGGFAVAGYVRGYLGNLPSGNVTKVYSASSDIWILKLSGVGNLLWQQTLGGTGEDVANSMTPTSDGGVVVAGQTASNDNNVTENHGMVDMWIIKIMENGTLSTKTTIGGGRNDYATSITASIDGGFVIAGSTNGSDGIMSGIYDSVVKSNVNMCILKIDKNVKLEWIKIFGGSGIESANSIIATSDGGYLAAGQTNSSNGDITLSKGNTDSWILKMDAKGNKLWQQSVGGSADDVATSVVELHRKGYMVVGSTYSNDGDIQFNHGGSDVFLSTFKNE